jgi:hypothetical protein
VGDPNKDRGGVRACVDVRKGGGAEKNQLKSCQKPDKITWKEQT